MLMLRSRLAFLVIAVLSSNTTRATVIQRLELPKLVAAADRIAVAHVERQAAESLGGGSAIVTRVTLRVVQSMKGKLRSGDRVEVLREGGEVGHKGMLVEGAARFAPGEDVLVFLEQRGGTTWTVGMAQGKMHIETVGGRRMVAENLNGLAFAGEQGRVIPAERRATRPLDEVLSTISALVRGAPGAKP